MKALMLLLVALLALGGCTYPVPNSILVQDAELLEPTQEAVTRLYAATGIRFEVVEHAGLEPVVKLGWGKCPPPISGGDRTAACHNAMQDNQTGSLHSHRINIVRGSTSDIPAIILHELASHVLAAGHLATGEIGLLAAVGNSSHLTAQDLELLCGVANCSQFSPELATD